MQTRQPTMKIAVDLTKYQNHGQCTYSAPHVFSLNDHGRLAFRDVAGGEFVSDDLGDAWNDDIEEAIDMCPVGAIRAVGGDDR